MVFRAVFAAVVVATLGGPLGCASADAKPDRAWLLSRGRSYDVEILRDAYGVPHIFGKRDVDAAYGLGFAHAEDDYETIELAILRSRGHLARHLGKDAAVSDYLVGHFRVRDAVAEARSKIAPEAMAVAAAWADGVNHWAVLHPGNVREGVVPVTAEDVVAGFVLKAPFFFGLESTLKELFAQERQRPVSSFGPVPVGSGSNAFAVAPGRSGDGVTRLIVNSHQPWEGEVAWYEAHVVSEEGWNAAGGTFPGAPLILHGHNQDLGWAFTVNLPDLIDVYVLEVDPRDDDQYRWGEGWKRFEKRDVDIEVDLVAGFTWTFTEESKWSVHGPVFSTDHGVYALRYAGMGEVRALEQWWGLNKAKTLDEWKAAMRMLAIPSLNAVYADKTGNVGFFYNARSPVRAPGVDWQDYLPGDRPELVWTETHPFDVVPQVVNPSSGFVFSSNHAPYRVTLGDDNPKPPPFAAEAGFDTWMTNRSLRALELFADEGPIDRERLLGIKFDKRYAEDSIVAQVRRMVLDDPGCQRKENPAPPVSDVLAACRALDGWDLSVERDRRGAALGIFAAADALQYGREGKPIEDPVPAFKRAVSMLKAAHGRVDPTWGEVNRLRRGDIDVAIGGGPDTLRAVYTAEEPENGRLIGAQGDSLVMLVEWGADGAVQTSTVHQFGSATLDDTSPHYADQVPLFVEEKWKVLPLEREAIEAEATRTYRPGVPEAEPAPLASR